MIEALIFVTSMQHKIRINALCEIHMIGALIFLASTQHKIRIDALRVNMTHDQSFDFILSIAKKAFRLHSRLMWLYGIAGTYKVVM